MAVSQHFLAWECTSRLDSRFLYYWFQYIRPELERIAVGSTIKTIGLGYFDKLRIPLPPPAAQSAIVSALYALDSTDLLIERLIERKVALRRGVMQQMIGGYKRFQEFRNRPWTHSRLSDHVSEVARRNTGAIDLVLTASGTHGLVDQRRYFTRNVAGADLSKYHLLRRGEFAYNRSAMIGFPYGATKRLDEHAEGALSTLYLCFSIVDPKLDSDYLKHIFDSGILNRQLRPIVRVGARAHGLLNVTTDDYLSVSIPLPEIDEQRRISDTLSAMNQELTLLDAQRKQIDRYKRGLLTRFLSDEFNGPG
jgi:type I restriction enzyme S subunit